ncbi:enoyl-CoA hydratase-related protein [Microbacterium sp. LWS13-1.2]|uniref:Enoyl-CoA hydratase-related protein n=1 Tax=Microbacterium sp. LWS13-1.2 TaxID=3135264 RepID=A0AAU6SBM7_9MICO
MTGRDVVLSEFVDDGVLLITLNRPERKNAVTDALRSGFAEAIRRADADPAVRVVAVTGAGDAFCAGADRKEPALTVSPGLGAAALDLETAMRRFHAEFAGAFYAVRKPTVALVNGAAAGGGMGLALAADFRIAGESSLFVSAFANLGLAGDNGVTYGLHRLVGRARALEILMLTPRIDAAEAERLGLVRQVVPDDALREEGLAFCRRLAAGPTAAFALMKTNLAAVEVSNYATSLDLEARGIGIAGAR